MEWLVHNPMNLNEEQEEYLQARVDRVKFGTWFLYIQFIISVAQLLYVVCAIVFLPPNRVFAPDNGSSDWWAIYTRIVGFVVNSTWFSFAFVYGTELAGYAQLIAEVHGEVEVWVSSHTKV